jgi:hypothetical protein
MKRPHRAAHRLMWLVLAASVALGLSMALALRPPNPLETGIAGDKSR